VIQGLHHVGVSVANLERAIGFYRGVLGMEVVHRGIFGGELYELVLGLKDVAGKVATLRLGTLEIEVFEFDSPRPRLVEPNRPVCDHGISHFCLHVSDIHGEYARLKAAGVAFHCPPQNFFGKAMATYGRDPDGNVFELLEMTSRP
jgi:catechol 2,3-dioxygenase-like lactoylglutathione lyase family enzyme